MVPVGIFPRAFLGPSRRRLHAQRSATVFSHVIRTVQLSPPTSPAAFCSRETERYPLFHHGEVRAHSRVLAYQRVPAADSSQPELLYLVLFQLDGLFRPLRPKILSAEIVAVEKASCCIWLYHRPKEKSRKQPRRTGRTEFVSATNRERIPLQIPVVALVVSLTVTHPRLGTHGSPRDTVRAFGRVGRIHVPCSQWLPPASRQSVPVFLTWTDF